MISKAFFFRAVKSWDYAVKSELVTWWVDLRFAEALNPYFGEHLSNIYLYMVTWNEQ